MKKKTLAAASLLLALLMPLGATPLAVYADEGEGTTQGETAPTAWDVSCSKDATALDENYTSEVTLALPSEEENLATDVVLALDVSKCTEKTLPAVKSLLNDLATVQKESGANIQIGISMFKGCAVPFQELTTLTPEKNTELQNLFDSFLNTTSPGDDPVEHAVRDYLVNRFGNEYLNTGTNMPAGLMLAKEMLDNDTNVKPSRKYMVLVSDGSTYLFTHDNDYSTAWSRQHMPGSYQGGLYECNWRCHDFLMSSDGNWTAWLESVSEFSKTFTDEYDYEWKGKNTVCPNPIPEDAPKYLINGDTSIYQSATLYKAMQAADYNCYYCYEYDSQDYYGRNTLKALNDDAHLIDAANTTNIFSNIEHEIIYAVDADSYVEDVIGDKFTLDVGSLSVSVDGKPLNKASISENSWTFSDDESTTDSYAVSYDSASKTITWSINKPITNFARVRLSYKVKLSNPETIPDSYSALTNQWAKLYPKDSAGADGRVVEFPQPKVSYTIYALNYDANGGNGAPDSVVNCTGKFTVSDTVPTRDGYVFAGWNTVADGSGTNCAAGSEIEGNKDSPALTLYAQWNKLVTVSFDLCGHGGANIPSQTFVSGNKASEPTAPQEDGWVFGGWYTEKGCQYRFSFDSAVTSDITLYAKWDRVTTVVSAPVATPTPSPAPAAAATKTATVKNAAIPQTSDAFPMEGLLALLAVGAVGFGAAGWLRKKHH